MKVAILQATSNEGAGGLYVSLDFEGFLIVYQGDSDITKDQGDIYRDDLFHRNHVKFHSILSFKPALIVGPK
jgi:hypothetical protein